MASRIDWQWDGDRELSGNIKELGVQTDRAVKATMDYHALEGTAYMKEHAPWTDRTGNARAGIHAKASNPAVGKYEIVFAHTVHYGLWLEIANSGRYQIIMPAVRREGELLMSRMEGLFSRLEDENS